MAAVQYHNLAVPVAKVEIDPIKVDPAAISALRMQIDALYRQLNEKRLAGKEKDALVARIRKLEQELAGLTIRDAGRRGLIKKR